MIKKDVITKQKQWALDDNGYFYCYQMNLFQPLTTKQLASFQKGNGNELTAVNDKRAKMSALHSSSALAVNAFACPSDVCGNHPEYWHQLLQYLSPTGKGFSLFFEKQLPISGISYGTPPNLDVFVKNDKSAIAIESKFTETLGKKTKKANEYFSPSYFKETVNWGNSKLQDFARKINDGKIIFIYLDAPQLIKHLLGLISWRHKNKNKNKTATLLYLYYDFNDPQHKQELQQFIAEINQCQLPVQFDELTYQNYIARLKNLATLDPKLDRHWQYMNARYSHTITSY